MTLPGFSLPELSAFDPPVEGEGSHDPMGLAAISDRLANLLVPGLRARMRRVRFVTAIAVGALACEMLADEIAADGVSTPSICFEWLVVEAFVRRLPGGQGFPLGVPGSFKARAVVARSQRLSAATYLKGPAVFGFHGVYKPFAVDSEVVGSGLEPGASCSNLTRRWEREQGFDGFTDGVPGTTGGRLRVQIRDAVRDTLRAGHCATNPSGRLFGHLTASLQPGILGVTECRALRALITDARHETRAELAFYLSQVTDDKLTEAQLLDVVRPECSAALGEIVDAVVAYERFAAMVDAAFRTLCSVSHALGSHPLTPNLVHGHEMITRCAAELPSRYRAAAECMSEVVANAVLEERLGEFAIERSPGELVELLLSHHEYVQAAKPPSGKRSWFDPVRDGWIVRSSYGSPDQPELGPRFVHPIRVSTLRRFLQDTKE